MTRHRTRQDQVHPAGLNFSRQHRPERNRYGHEGGQDGQMEVAQTDDALKGENAAHRGTQQLANDRRQEHADLIEGLRTVDRTGNQDQEDLEHSQDPACRQNEQANPSERVQQNRRGDLHGEGCP